MTTVAGSISQLVRDLRGFDRRREVVAQLRKELREPVPDIRKAVRRRALDTLPRSGGLGKWAAKTRVSAVVRVSSRSAAIRLKGSRRSEKNKSDLRALDRGRARHPSWGRRGKGQWHTQTVPEAFFRAPVAQAGWRHHVEVAVGRALDTIRRG